MVAVQNAFSYGQTYTKKEIEVAASCIDDREGNLIAHADVREYVFRPEGDGFILDHTWRQIVLGRDNQ